MYRPSRCELVLRLTPAASPATRSRRQGGRGWPECPGARVRTNSAGVFSVQLPAGRYQVSDRSPRLLEVSANGTSHQEWSAPVAVIVTAHHTHHDHPDQHRPLTLRSRLHLTGQAGRKG